jgi:Domain of unknown function (DUF6532)
MSIESSMNLDSLPPRTKRYHDSDDEGLFEVHVTKAQKITSNSGCPKAGDYDPATKGVILSAANTYCALLVSQGAFPSSSEDLDLVKQTWKRVHDDGEIDPLLKLTTDFIRIVSFSFLIPSVFLALTVINLNPKVKARGPQVRGEAKAKTASLVEALYGFDSGRTKKIIAENCKKAEESKSDKGFVFKVCSHYSILFVSFLLILIYGVRYSRILKANEKEFTNIQSFKRLLTRCGSKINAMRELYILISGIAYHRLFS